MDYEDISTIVVLVVLVVFIIGWLPIRTADSMKRVVQRRQDRFSPSLHLIDERSGTRFSDDHPPVTKGAAMPVQAQGRVSHEHIAEVRRLRRASIRHRRIVVAVLVCAAVIVAVAAYLLHFPMAYALIPCGLLVVTLALGARASRHARQWEHKVAQALRQEHQMRSPAATREQAAPAVSAAQTGAPAVASAPADTPSGADAVETGIMEQHEIHRAVEQTLAERDQALARKAAQARRKDERPARPVQAGQPGRPAQPADVSEQDGRHVPASAADASAADAHASDARHEVADKSAEAVSAESAPVESAPAEPKDVTVELSRVSPATSLDVFDMAAERHQDLISFSWGAPRNHADEPAAPESLEIKSTKQVAKAVPVDAGETEPGKTSGSGDRSADDVRTHDAAVNNADSFHRTEEHARVDVPEATSDSLGHDLRAVLERRAS
ncbi:hypothetical protein WD012_01750 [Bifidobacterium thermophilum]